MRLNGVELRARGARSDWIEWLYARGDNNQYQEVLNALAEEDNSAFASWLVRQVGADRYAEPITSVPARAKHLFASGDILIDGSVNVPGNVFAAGQIDVKGNLWASSVFAGKKITVRGHLACTGDIETTDALFADEGITSQGSVIAVYAVKSDGPVTCGGKLTTSSYLHAKDLHIGHNLFCANSVHVSGGNATVYGDVYIEATLFARGDVASLKSLRVGGYVDVEGDLCAERGIYVGCGINAGGKIEHGEDWACFAGLAVEATQWDRLAVVSARVPPKRLFGGVWKGKAE